jgi:catechol 2,3-dioxygenase-like lactoylglutathione lyase family enzyme
MLTDTPVMITFSVNDLAKAKEFYTQSLGLEVDESMPEMLQLKLGEGSKVMVYSKKNHLPATYTLLNFTVTDLEKTMKELTAKGVAFERYNLPDITSDDQGVVDYGVMKIAFFNDPAGNNHAVLQMTNS